MMVKKPSKKGEKMANRRLFSKSVIYSDSFFGLPSDALKLYVYMMLEADDEGFIGHTKSILRMADVGRDILDMLKERGLVYEFKSGVCLIAHWRKQNIIDRQGYTPTEFKIERCLVYLDEDVYYPCVDLKDSE